LSCCAALCQPITAIAATINAFGDSITSGNLQKTSGYALILADKLNNSGKPSTVINNGKWGETTTAGVMRIDSTLAAFPADIVLIMEGSNDVISGISVEITQANLQAMIRKVKGAGAIPVLSTLPPSNRGNSPTLIPRIWNPMIKGLAGINDIRLVDMYSAVQPTWERLNRDGIHPNESGNAVIAETWFNAISTIISPTGAVISNNYGDDSLCFLATAAFDSPIERQMTLLKEFRDTYLLTNAIGRQFVATYYRYSPPAANFIRHHKYVKLTVRVLLYPLIAISYVSLKLSLPIRIIVAVLVAATGLALITAIVKRRRRKA